MFAGEMSGAGAPSSLSVGDEEFDARLECVNSGLSCDDAIQLVACLLEQTMFKPSAVSLRRLRIIQRAGEQLVPRLRAERKFSEWQRRVLCAPVEPQCRRTALHICAVYDLSEQARVLLEMGWSCGERDIRSWTALRCAQVHDSRGVVRLLMPLRDSSSSGGRRDDDAESRCCVEEVERLSGISAAPPPPLCRASYCNAGSAGSAAGIAAPPPPLHDSHWLRLMRAIVHGDSAGALRMIAGHVSRYTPPADQHARPLVLDFIDGPLEDEGEMLERSDPFTGQTPLYLAALLGRHDVARSLLAVPYLRPSNQVRTLRLTALTAAMCRRDAAMTGVLLASPRVRLSDLVHSFLHGVFARHRHHDDDHHDDDAADDDDDTACLRLLLAEERLRPCSQHALAEAALFTACSVGNVRVVAELLSAGVDVNTNKWSMDGETPLMRAAYHGHAKLVSYLLTVPGITLLGRCQKFIRNDTLLHRAVRGGNLVCLKRILRKYPGPTDSVNLEGLQPVALAAKHNQHHATMLLLRLSTVMRYPFTSSGSRSSSSGGGGNDVIADADTSLAARVAAEHAHTLLGDAIRAKLVFPLAWWSATAVARQLRAVHGGGAVGDVTTGLPLPDAMMDLVLDCLAGGC